jgi:hypothetical protein
VRCEAKVSIDEEGEDRQWRKRSKLQNPIIDSGQYDKYLCRTTVAFVRLVLVSQSRR